jgi:hypothetical protein
MGRWTSRDPIGESGSALAAIRQNSESGIDQEVEAELYALLSRVDPALAAQLMSRPGSPHSPLYLFAGNSPPNEFDPLGLICFVECWRTCIKDNYGKSFDIALGLSYLSVAQIVQDVYTRAVEAAAIEKLKNLNLAGAFKKGGIVKKMQAAEKAASAAKSLSSWSKVLSTLSKATAIVSAAATGYVVGASSYCTGQCLAE